MITAACELSKLSAHQVAWVESSKNERGILQLFLAAPLWAGEKRLTTRHEGREERQSKLVGDAARFKNQ